MNNVMLNIQLLYKDNPYFTEVHVSKSLRDLVFEKGRVTVPGVYTESTAFLSTFLFPECAEESC